jgi:hypothetical protein
LDKFTFTDSIKAQVRFQQAVSRLVNEVNSEGGDEQQSTTHADRVASLQTLKKLFENVVENPQEEKFHRVKLSNVTVNKRLVQVQNGAGKYCLHTLDFAEWNKRGNVVCIHCKYKWSILVLYL